jgi:hypothetical protein
MNNVSYFHSAFTISFNRSVQPLFLPPENKGLAEITKVLLVTGVAAVFIGLLWLLQNFLFAKLCVSAVATAAANCALPATIATR